MKKFLAVFAVLAMVCLSSIAFAADVTVGGEVAVRSRDFNNLLLDKTIHDNTSNTQVDTQTRIKLDVNVKAGDNVKGKVELWNDFDTWGNRPNGTGLESAKVGSPQGLGFREAWVNFNIPDVPVNVTAGHQLLALGHGFFFASRHFGSDAWVVANVTGNNTLAFVDVKAFEGATSKSDDLDAYVILDSYKINDTNTIGIDIANVNDRKALLSGGTSTTSTATALSRAGAAGAFDQINLYNVSVNYTGTFGPVNLKFQGDMQSGKMTASAFGIANGVSDADFKGWEAVLMGNVALDPASVNFTLAMGSGNKQNSNDIDQFINILDIDPHYTFLYEYKVPTVALNVASPAAANDNLNTGFANTTAANIGGTYAVAKSLKIGLNYWFLQATEKVVNAHGDSTNEVGQEIDATINWQLYENLSWNWNLGMFLPGKAYDKADGSKGDDATGIQGILALKF